MTLLSSATETLIADNLQRQLTHWTSAARIFLDAEEFASETAWRSLENHVGLPIRRSLAEIISSLIAMGANAEGIVRSARRDSANLVAATRAVQLFRRRYSQVETTLDFFGDAVNSRTNLPLRSALRVLDQLSVASMTPVLSAAGCAVPPVLTYVDKGLGASILRSGIRLWSPGSINPVAAIKIVRHNLYRPTSLFHETGHQVANLIGWVPALQTSMSQALADDRELRSMWLPWCSEIVADVYAFTLTGFASVSALFDVVGDDRTLMRWPVGDPHPVGWLRTLLGCAMCRESFGPGPWDALESAMRAQYPAARADATTAPLLSRSALRMPQIARVCLTTSIPALEGRPITRVLNPARVSPSALADLERDAGRSLWISPHWQQREGIRMLALSGLREAERPQAAPEWIERARTWMTTPLNAA